jgi:hypothetical protein
MNVEGVNDIMPKQAHGIMCEHAHEINVERGHERMLHAPPSLPGDLQLLPCPPASPHDIAHDIVSQASHRIADNTKLH